MLLRKVLVSALLVLGVNFYGCTSDEQAIKNPVDANSAEGDAAAAQGDADKANSDLSADNTVYFTFDSSALDDKAQERLTKLSSDMKTSKSRVQLAGHTCDIGTPEYNLALGARRSESAKNFLVQLGVEKDRLTTISYGKEKPAVDGSSEDTRSKNRRVEFTAAQ